MSGFFGEGSEGRAFVSGGFSSPQACLREFGRPDFWKLEIPGLGTVGNRLIAGPCRKLISTSSDPPTPDRMVFFGTATIPTEPPTLLERGGGAGGVMFYVRPLG